VTQVLVLHEVGDAAGGARWRDAFGADAEVPDLPGHGSAPPPAGGHYELYDVVFAASDWVDADPVDVLVGIGKSGWSAQVLAIGGRTRRLALVDGLGGPWGDAAEVIDEGVRWTQVIAADPAAVGPAPVGEPDPRLRHGVPAMRSRRMAERAAAACPVPVLIVHTPSSPLDERETRELAELYADARVVVLDDDEPASIADAVLRW
jgi:hypothetical protein